MKKKVKNDVNFFFFTKSDNLGKGSDKNFKYSGRRVAYPLFSFFQFSIIINFHFIHQHRVDLIESHYCTYFYPYKVLRILFLDYFMSSMNSSFI